MRCICPSWTVKMPSTLIIHSSLFRFSVYCSSYPDPRCFSLRLAHRTMYRKIYEWNEALHITPAVRRRDVEWGERGKWTAVRIRPLQNYFYNPDRIQVSINDVPISLLMCVARWSDTRCSNSGFRKSSHMTAAIEFRPLDTVLSVPLYRHARKSPGNPTLLDSTSTTK